MQAKITRELVFELADALEAEGARITSTSIKGRNGNHGNLTAISVYMKQWKEYKKQKERKAIPIDMPDNLNELFRPILEEMAKNFMEWHNEQVSADQKKIGELTTEKSQWTEEKQALEAQVDRLEEEIEDHKQNSANYFGQLEQTVQQNSQLLDKLEKMTACEKATREELAAVNARNILLVKECRELTADKSVAESQLATAQKLIKQLEMDLADESKINTEHLITISKLEDSLREMVQQFKATNIKLDGSKKLIAQQDVDLIDLRKELAVAQERASGVDDLKTRYRELEQDIRTLHKENHRLIKQNHGFKTRNEEPKP